MLKLVASKVEIEDEAVSYGYGRICFQWLDPVFGYDELSIDLEGFCSRRMPLYSGAGPPAFTALERDRVVLQFAPALAKQLLLDEEVVITFSISEGDLQRLEKLREILGA
jgi:hypothetical protein